MKTNHELEHWTSSEPCPDWRLSAPGSGSIDLVSGLMVSFRPDDGGGVGKVPGSAQRTYSIKKEWTEWYSLSPTWPPGVSTRWIADSE